MALLNPKHPNIGEVNTSKPEEAIKQLAEKVRLLEDGQKQAYIDLTNGVGDVEVGGTTTDSFNWENGAYGQFHCVTKKDLTTSWADLDNLVVTDNVTLKNVSLNVDTITIEFTKTGVYRISYLAMFNMPNQESSPRFAVRALKNTTEIKGSWAPCGDDYYGRLPTSRNSVLVDITATTDTVHFEVTGNTSNCDLASINGAEADPTTRTNFNCVVKKIDET